MQNLDFNVPNIDEYDLNEESYNSLLGTIKWAMDFETDKYSSKFLKRRIFVRLRATGLKSYKEYEKLIISNKYEQLQLLKNLSINVTEFFRDVEFWQFCYGDFFIRIITLLSKKKKIRIWSAGCSSGQEAISILITFLELNKRLKEKILIFCTDINEEILKKARNAEYDAFGMKGLSDEIIDKYFMRNEETVKLKQFYKSNFIFLQHDVLKDKPIENIDVIFCRNTVIYFAKESKENLYLKLYDSLKFPTFFVLGKTETLTGKARLLFKIYNVQERIFEKISN